MLTSDEAVARARAMFGKELGGLREAARLTKAQLAAAAGVPASTVSFTEAGQRRASDAYVRAIAGQLETSADDLLARRDELELVFAILTHPDRTVDRVLDRLGEFRSWAERLREGGARPAASGVDPLVAEIARRAAELTPGQQQRVLDFLDGLRASG